MDAETFSSADLEQIQSRGQNPDSVRGQLKRFQKGFPPLILERPCRVGDGILRLSAQEMPRYQHSFAQAAAAGRAMKFVPASGAGTRLFQRFLTGLHGEAQAGLDAEMARLPEYPFYEALQAAMQEAGFSLQQSLAEKAHRIILEFLLTERGLNYAALPKAFIPFHCYPDGVRTALEEQLSEAASLFKDSDGLCRIHFTVSEEYLAHFQEFLAKLRPRYESGGLKFEAEFSIQSRATDTVAADPAGRPFRDRAGRMLFRPAGHGALLENLQLLKGDLVFLKNIDNVAPESHRGEGDAHRRALGGLLAEMQESCFEHLRRLDGAGCSETELESAAQFAVTAFSKVLPVDWISLSFQEKKSWLQSQLHRPLRVCGVVPNRGEPGGAPFWVRGRAEELSLQIVESAQVDLQDQTQREIFRSSTHFNPVDLACGLRDYRGKPFDLSRFRDPETGFISQKSHEGRPLQAMELPGLWNGAMAFWNTIFVEIPPSAFTPVKQIEDLLRPEHAAP